ncbi:hypothetical protein QF034_001134 [Streptomyces africanus]|uniref:Uncharacterized protein n=1 Tax=Streptomyces africanus TaxID=231024 RepID=A0ABU0QHP5_9ACTN|nr:hypothetical protein [Streptomyces africanus]
MARTRKLSEFVAEDWLEGEAESESDVVTAWDRWRIERAEHIALGEQRPAPLVEASWVETQELSRAIARLGAARRAGRTMAGARPSGFPRKDCDEQLRRGT